MTSDNDDHENKTLTMALIHVVVGGAETEHCLCPLNAKAALDAAHQTLVMHHKLGPATCVKQRLK